MKRTILSSFILLFCTMAFSQFSLTGGVRFQRDKLPKTLKNWNHQAYNLPDGYRGSGAYNQYFVTGAFEKQRVRYHVGTTLISEHMRIDTKDSRSYGSQGGNMTNYYYENKAQLRYNLIGLRLGVDYVIRDGNSFSMLIGGFYHIDGCVSYKSYDHWSRYTKNGNNQAEVVIEDTEEFEVLRMNRFSMSAGLSLKPRWQWKQFLFEIQLSTAAFMGAKYWVVLHNSSDSGAENRQSERALYYGYEIGFGIGYLFPSKPKTN